MLMPRTNILIGWQKKPSCSLIVSAIAYRTKRRYLYDLYSQTHSRLTTRYYSHRSMTIIQGL